MSLMDLFKSKGSARPSAGSQKGDWKDWFLNREGMAGKFNRRKDEDDWIDWKVAKELMESWIGIRREVRT